MAKVGYIFPTERYDSIKNRSDNGNSPKLKEDPQPRCVVKLTPERNEELREQFSAVTPAWHWNKKHWSDVYYELLDNSLVTAWIKESYDLVVSKLPKAVRCKYQ